jgi:hypothetical protein
MIFVFLAGTFILPFGALLSLAGKTLELRGWWRWPGQLLIIAWPLMYGAFFKWVF